MAVSGGRWAKSPPYELSCLQCAAVLVECLSAFESLVSYVSGLVC